MVTSMSGSRSRGGTAGDVIPKGFEKARLQQYDKPQMDVYNRDFSKIGPDSYLSKLAGGDQDLYNELEAPAFRQFSALQGGLASRFSGMGSGARRSSGFQNEGTAAASNFAEQLQSQRMGLRRQAMQDLHGMTEDILGRRPYDDSLVEKQPKKPGFDWGGLANAGIQAGIGFATGGPAGAIAGGANALLTRQNARQQAPQSYGSQYYQSSSNNFNLPQRGF